jgi:hypothetical protein
VANIFEGKTVIITGASAGVGRACAEAFANVKANLVLVARGEQALTQAATELSIKTGVLSVAMDVADTAACIDLMAKAEAEFGRIDVLINNAGMHARGDVETKTPTEIAAMVDVNLRSPLVLSSAVIPYLRKVGGGAIVNVGSLAGRAPLQGAATYCATKAGLRAFTYAIADEIQASGIKIGVVSPGPIDTGFIMDEIDLVEDIVFSQPMSSAEQVAEAIIELATEDTVELSMPAFSGKLTTLSYLFPSLRRKLRPKLYEQGKKNKDKYRQRNS